MSVADTRFSFHPGRIGPALQIVLRYTTLGPLIGALAFMAEFAVVGFPRQGPEVLGPVVGFSPFFVFGAYVVALAPAVGAGVLAAIEFLLRGRVSWLVAGAAPLLTMTLNYFYWPTTFTAPGFFWIGVGSSLALRHLFSRLMQGDGVHAETLSFTTSEFGGGVARLMFHRRVALVLIYAVAVPVIVSLVYALRRDGNPFTMKPWDVYVGSLIFTTIGAALLAFVTRPGKSVTVLNAMWTQAPAWGLVVLGAGHDREELALLMVVSMTATAIVTIALRKQLRV